MWWRGIRLFAAAVSVCVTVSFAARAGSIFDPEELTGPPSTRPVVPIPTTAPAVPDAPTPPPPVPTATEPVIPKPVEVPIAPARVAAPTLRAVPAAKAQEDALKEVKETFKDEYRATGERRAVAAGKLLKAGVENLTDPVVGFVLLREARDMASAAGDARTGIAAARQIASHYTTDLTEMGLDVLKAAARNAASPERAADVTTVAMALLQRATDTGQLDLAARIAGIAEASARTMHATALVNNLQAIGKDLRNREANILRLSAARATLEKDPNNSDAKGIVGRQLCLDEGNWAEGLPLLAVSTDAGLKSLASRDLAGPAGPEAQAELANQWWTTAQTLPVTARRRGQERAAFWYSKAQGGLTGKKKEEAVARIAAAEKVLADVLLMQVPVAAEPGKARSERQALDTGASPLRQTEVKTAMVINSGKPQFISSELTVDEKAAPLDITLGPGAELRGGKIELSGRGHLKLQGSAEKPAVLRGVTIGMDLGGSFEAEYAVLDNCTFIKDGAWFSYESSKWTFRNCTMYKCKFPRLDGVDYGFKFDGCRIVGTIFPEITHSHDPVKPYHHLDRLRHTWNHIAGCEFVDCAVPPTVAWCAEDSNFIACRFLRGEALEGDADFEWRAFVADTAGQAPQVVFDAHRSPGGKVLCVRLEQIADVPRVGEKLIPEMTYATKAVVRDD